MILRDIQIGDFFIHNGEVLIKKTAYDSCVLSGHRIGEWIGLDYLTIINPVDFLAVAKLVGSDKVLIFNESAVFSKQLGVQA